MGNIVWLYWVKYLSYELIIILKKIFKIEKNVHVLVNEHMHEIL